MSTDVSRTQRGDATILSRLEKHAAATPERAFIVMDRGDSRTFGAFNAEANRFAHGLAALGVSIGDHVAVMLTSSLESIVATFALRKLGAVEISVHTRTRGAGLLHVLDTSKPMLLIVADELSELVGDLGADCPPFDVVAVGDAEQVERTLPGRKVTSYRAVFADRDDDPGVSFHDTQMDCVLFTSGTTGPAKGCMLSHRAGTITASNMVRAHRFTGEDCLYCPYPASHVDSRFMTVGAAAWVGCRAAIGRRFSVSGFWEEIRRFEATVFDFMGSTLTMLWNQEPRADDLDNPVRLAWGVPLPAFAPEFEERFGLRITTGFGATDTGNIASRDPDLVGEPPDSSGHVMEPYEVRIGDSRDDPLPTGEVGEILVRSTIADSTMKGYLGMPEKTAEVFRNMWLHTGDLGRLDADGRLYFEGRSTESIRRRGENISAFEVEQALEAHPEVLEAVAVGVPAEIGEEEVCAYLVLREDSTLTGGELNEFLAPRLADFMVPRIVRAVPAIPRTDTDKPEKFKLIDGGVEGERPL